MAGTNAGASMDREVTTIRTVAAWLLTAVAATLVVAQTVLLLSPVPAAASPGAQVYPLFSSAGLLVLGGPVLAVLFATRIGHPIRTAAAVVLAALAVYVGLLLYYALYLAYLVTNGVAFIGGSGSAETARVVTHVAVEVLLFGLLIIAAAYVDHVRRALRDRDGADPGRHDAGGAAAARGG